MSINSFLYRRLARWITCEFRLSGGRKISLQNKYEVASFNDVFCHPFYWQVFQWLETSPKLVVDCGAHCGHFTILADICIQSKFPDSETQYVLIEPNPNLISAIKKNLENVNLVRRTCLKQGLLGRKVGKATFMLNKSFLQAGLYSKNGKPHSVNYLDLSKIVGEQTIDLMKVDIEKGEFEFVKHNLDIFAKTNLLFMELHQASEELHLELYNNLQSVGLYPVIEPISCHGQQLVIFRRR